MKLKDKIWYRLSEKFLFLLLFIAFFLICQITLCMFIPFKFNYQYIVDVLFIFFLFSITFPFKSNIPILIESILVGFFIAFLDYVNINLYLFTGDIFTFDKLYLVGEAANAMSKSFISVGGTVTYVILIFVYFILEFLLFFVLEGKLFNFNSPTNLDYYLKEHTKEGQKRLNKPVHYNDRFDFFYSLNRYNNKIRYRNYVEEKLKEEEEALKLKEQKGKTPKYNVPFDEKSSKGRRNRELVTRIVPTSLLLILGMSISIPFYSSKSALNAINGVTYPTPFYQALFKRDSIVNKSFFNFYYNDLISTVSSSQKKSDEKDMLGRLLRNKSSSNENEFSGLLKNYNVVNILFETGQEFAVNKYLTPTLYRLTGLNYQDYDKNNTESETSLYYGTDLIMDPNSPYELAESYEQQIEVPGIRFNQIRCENKTNISEYLSMFGFSPVTGFPANVKIPQEVNLKHALPRMLKEQGYKTVYAHDNYSSFYERNKNMPLLGFDTSYFHDTIYGLRPDDMKTPSEYGNISIQDYEYRLKGDVQPDTNTMDRLIELFEKNNDLRTENDENFYFQYASISSHAQWLLQFFIRLNNPSFASHPNYDPKFDQCNNMHRFTQKGYFAIIDQAEKEGKWTNLLEDLTPETGYLYDYGESFKFYQAAVMDFDRAVNKLIKYLKEIGQYDKTLFAIFGDHNAYYYQMAQLQAGIESSPDWIEPDTYRTYFALYNPDLSKAYYQNNENSYAFDRMVNPGVIPPTVLDLLGVNYYPDLYLSRTIFDKNYYDLTYSNKVNTFFNHKYISKDGHKIEDRSKDLVSNRKYFQDGMYDMLSRLYDINYLFNNNLLDDYEDFYTNLK